MIVSDDQALLVGWLAGWLSGWLLVGWLSKIEILMVRLTVV